jgi:general stress protein 26
MAQIQSNNAACAYFCRPKEWRGLMLQGNIEIITEPTIKQSLWQDGWTMYYPTGVNDPEYTVLCLKPLLGKGYHQLNSYILDLGGEKCS